MLRRAEGYVEDVNLAAKAAKKQESDFRTDIQGLRALAVIGVLIFHVDPKILQGGFLGVDVFFVISGFVIGRILLKEFLDHGQVQLASFFAKRFFRLVPALAGVTATVAIFGNLFFTSQTLRETVNLTAIGSLTGTSNWVIAWVSGGYFGRAPELNPLLHTWSLSAEWQFYVLLPLVFLAVQRLRFSIRTKTAILVAAVFFLGLVSFFFNFLDLSDFAQGRVDLNGYYSPLGRFWEFSAGVLVAACEKFQPPNKIAGDVIGFAGLTLVLFAFYFFQSAMQTPGRSTLIPVIGTVLIIVGGSNRNTIVSRVFSTRSLTWIGDHSYSIYLWHWPILFFMRAFGLFDMAFGLLVFVFFTLLVSSASLRFLEKKNSYSALLAVKRRKSRIYGLLVIPFLVIAASELSSARYDSILISGGLIETIRGDVGHDSFHEFVAENFAECGDEAIRSTALIWDSFLRCQQTTGVSDVTVAIVGDSHAEHLFSGLASSNPDEEIAYYIRGELPLPTSSPEMARILKKVSETQSIEVVLVSAYWAARGIPELELTEVIRGFVASGKRVFLTNDIPTSEDFDPSQCKTSPFAFSKRKCEFDVYRFESTVGIDKTLARIASRAGAELIDTYSLVCPLGQSRCSMSVFDESDTETLIYRDSNHLNLDGSSLIAQELGHYLDLQHSLKLSH